MTSVPIIDLVPARGGDHADRLAVARAMDTACREIGFFAITGHGIPDAVVEDLRGRAHALFALPLPAKLAARHPVPGTNRGYHPVAGETLAAANDAPALPDLKGIAAEPLVVTGLYGGVDWGPTDAWIQTGRATIVICTFEKADALLRYLGVLFLNRVRLVVVDEAHEVRRDP